MRGAAASEAGPSAPSAATASAAATAGAGDAGQLVVSRRLHPRREAPQAGALNLDNTRRPGVLFMGAVSYNNLIGFRHGREGGFTKVQGGRNVRSPFKDISHASIDQRLQGRKVGFDQADPFEGPGFGNCCKEKCRAFGQFTDRAAEARREENHALMRGPGLDAPAWQTQAASFCSIRALVSVSSRGRW